MCLCLEESLVQWLTHSFLGIIPRRWTCHFFSDKISFMFSNSSYFTLICVLAFPTWIHFLEKWNYVFTNFPKPCILVTELQTCIKGFMSELYLPYHLPSLNPCLFQEILGQSFLSRCNFPNSHRTFVSREVITSLSHMTLSIVILPFFLAGKTQFYLCIYVSTFLSTSQSCNMNNFIPLSDGFLANESETGKCFSTDI